MRQYTEKELDEMIKAVLRAKLDNCAPPPAEEAWARLKEKMPQISQIKRPFRPGKRLLPGIAIAAIFILLTVTIFSLSIPKTVRALGYKVMDGITVLLRGTEMNLRGGVTSDEAAKPPPLGEKDIRQMATKWLSQHVPNFEQVKANYRFIPMISEGRYMVYEYRWEAPQKPKGEEMKPFVQVSFAQDGTFLGFIDTRPLYGI